MSRITNFDNGLRIVTEEMPHAASVAIGVFVGIGSRDEMPSQHGICHFLEHLAFKGTGELSAKELAVLVDSFGGDMNAYTTREMTSFQVHLLGEAANLGSETLCKILTAPAFDVGDVDSERSVILEEIAMAYDEASDYVHELLGAAVFGEHPLGREVLGSRESILAIDRASIWEFFSKYYGPSNMVVSAAGALSHESIVAQFEPFLGSLSGGSSSTRSRPVLNFSTPVVAERDIEQVHVSIAFPGLGRLDDRKWTLAILDHVLGGGLSSRLFQRVREEAGLCYSIYSDRVAYQDTGYFHVYFAASPMQVAYASNLVDSVIEAFVAGGITEEELTVAKRYLRSQILLAMEDTVAIMSQLGSVLVTGQQIKPVEEILSLVEHVTVEEVADLAAEILSGSRQISAVGPVPSGIFG